MDEKLKAQVKPVAAAIMGVLGAMGVGYAQQGGSGGENIAGAVAFGVLGVLALLGALYGALLWAKARSHDPRDGHIEWAMSTLMRTIVAVVLLVGVGVLAIGATQIALLFKQEDETAAPAAAHVPDFPACRVILMAAPSNASSGYLYGILCDGPIPALPTKAAEASTSEAPRPRRWTGLGGHAALG